MTVGLDLDQYQWGNRLLLVFAPTPDDVRYIDATDLRWREAAYEAGSRGATDR